MAISLQVLCCCTSPYSPGAQRRCRLFLTLTFMASPASLLFYQLWGEIPPIRVLWLLPAAREQARTAEQLAKTELFVLKTGWEESSSSPAPQPTE